MWNNTSANERLYLSLHGIVQTGESSGSTGVTTTSSSNEVYTNYAECARLSVKSNGQTNVFFFTSVHQNLQTFQNGNNTVPLMVKHTTTMFEHWSLFGTSLRFSQTWKVMLHVCMCVSMHVCMCVCMYVYVYMLVQTVECFFCFTKHLM